ncbi:MAG: hypothetical protein Q7T25_03490 [Sideroxyarcus sp.]|nr:hypothetical protein [Sideroxyarcus sp.]
MWDLNTLAVRYYLEDFERAAKHDIAEQKHRGRTGSIGRTVVDLMRILGSAFSPFAVTQHHHSDQEQRLGKKLALTQPGAVPLVEPPRLYQRTSSKNAP